MVWSVAYRDGNGRQGTMQVEADTRPLVISKMRERGLAVVNISDASGLAENARRRTEKRATTCHRILAALVTAAVLAGIAWYFFVRRNAVFHDVFDAMRPSGPVSIRASSVK